VVIVTQSGSAAVSPKAGTCKTNFGLVTLTQSGANVSGTYPHDSGKIEGRLERAKAVI
jgi:hypothetical protein